MDINCLEIFIPQYNEKIVASKVSNMLEQFKKEDEKIECLNQIIEYHKTKNFKDDLTLITLRHDYKNEPLLLSELDSYEPILKYLEGELSQLRDIKNFKNVRTLEFTDEYCHMISDFYKLLITAPISLIHKETKLKDFTLIFCGVKTTEISNPVIWLGNQTTLVKILNYLINKKIIYDPKPQYKSLDFCFSNKRKGGKFNKAWKHTNFRIQYTTITENDKYEEIKSFFH